MTMFEMDIPMTAQKGKAAAGTTWGIAKAHQAVPRDAKGGQHHDHHQRNRVKTRPKSCCTILLTIAAFGRWSAKRDGGFQPSGQAALWDGDDSFYLRGGVRSDYSLCV